MGSQIVGVWKEVPELKRQKQAVTAGLIVASIEVSERQREGKEREGNWKKESSFPPHWSSFISPGRREKCQLRCWEFISPATCTVIVLYSESLGLHQAWACKWGVGNWLPKSQEQETSKFAKVCGAIWIVKSTSGTEMRRGCFKM